MPIDADIDAIMELFEMIQGNKITHSKEQKIPTEKEMHNMWSKRFHKVRLYFRLEENDPKCNYVWDLLHASEDGRLEQTIAMLRQLKMLTKVARHKMRV